MSVRFDGSADALTRTTNLPPIATWTIMGWFKISVDRNAFSCFYNFGHATNSLAVYTIETLADGTTLSFYDGDTTTNGSALTVGTWYHIATAVAGTGAGQALTYLNGVLDITAAGDVDPTADKLWVGNDIDVEFLNGCAAAIKIWNVALTGAEVAAEMWQYTPVRITNLNAWHPMLAANVAGLIDDQSTNQRTWTQGGSLASESGPPIPWRRYKRKASFKSAAAAGAAPVLNDLAHTPQHQAMVAM
jgi:hypothetical protein